MLGQLISIIQNYTLDDPIQKSRVRNLLKTVLVKMDLSVETIDLITKVYYHMIPKNLEFIDEYFEIMTSIQYTKPEPAVEISPDEIRRQELRVSRHFLIFFWKKYKNNLSSTIAQGR